VSLDVLSHIPALEQAGVSALKIEGRQRGGLYISQVVGQIRKALTKSGSGPRWTPCGA
jgi:putative protease